MEPEGSLPHSQKPTTKVLLPLFLCGPPRFRGYKLTLLQAGCSSLLQATINNRKGTLYRAVTSELELSSERREVSSGLTELWTSGDFGNRSVVAVTMRKCYCWESNLISQFETILNVTAGKVTIS
jgi:hypothetical protein